MSSRVQGSIPARVMAATALPAASIVGEEGEHGGLGRGSRTETQDRLGDDPQRPLRPDDEVGQRVARHVLHVAAAGADDAPVGEDDLQASTASRVTPYFTQHRPPALVPMLPPIEQNSKLAGSGA